MRHRNDYIQQQEAEAELYERTIAALDHVAKLGIPEADMRLLSWHCGVDYDKEIKPWVILNAT